MAFIRNIMEDVYEESDQTRKEIHKIAKSRGFEDGRYNFVPNINSHRSIGTINNGKVEGVFLMNNDEKIILNSEDFYSKDWEIICAAMGYGYNDPTEIKSFKINPGATIEVSVSIETPKED